MEQRSLGSGCLSKTAGGAEVFFSFLFFSFLYLGMVARGLFFSFFFSLLSLLFLFCAMILLLGVPSEGVWERVRRRENHA
jgi:uncharacterized membrane protein